MLPIWVSMFKGAVGGVILVAIYWVSWMLCVCVCVWCRCM